MFSLYLTTDSILSVSAQLFVLWNFPGGCDLNSFKEGTLLWRDFYFIFLLSLGVYVLFSGQRVCAFIWRDGANIAAPPCDGTQVQPLWWWTERHHSALWGTWDPRATSQLEGSCRGCREGRRNPLLRLQPEGKFSLKHSVCKCYVF